MSFFIGKIAYVHFLFCWWAVFLVRFINLNIRRLDLWRIIFFMTFLISFLIIRLPGVKQCLELSLFLLLDLFTVPFNQWMRCLLLRAALTLDLVPILRRQTALRVSFLRFTRGRFKPEEALQVVLFEVNRLDRVLRADGRDVKLEKGLAAALRGRATCETLVVHEKICLVLLLRSGDVMFHGTLRGLRDLFCIL